ncbi:flagellar protein export ATPase FliI [Treponema pedis]|uniref:flagellar protein export ATPase FliI n=1 Tax=Treponema pedis TaxID=409322 RepID=UPI00197EA718|nr:flagellar protein export ATPase FliI [Treponema pedis]QSI05253.1 flagellar protein export ATPase FliI [Treponema pedis]
MISIFDKYTNAVTETDPIKFTGRVVRVHGMLIESEGPVAVVGELCQIITDDKPKGLKAEVVGLNGNIVQLMSFTDVQGVKVGDVVIASGEILSIPVGNVLLGRVVDSLCQSADGKPEPYSDIRYPVTAPPPDPMKRKPIRQRIVTGIRAIDGLLAVGRGQRLGIFSGSGIGKSTLLGMIARNTNADVNVIALIGERGREVVDFIEHDLGPEGLKHSVIVTATSDQSPLARIRGAYTATAIAEYFRDRGKDVMLLFDSVTRFARAQREIGLAIGEPPATRGYTPSVFETMPKLLERSGTSDKGSITGFYTVLVDGDDMDEPISDTVRGILDGHIVLERRLAQRGQYPAINVLRSISRLANRVAGENTKKAVTKARNLLAAYTESEDMILVGAYQKGSDANIDDAIEHYPLIYDFLTQDVNDPAKLEDTLKKLSEITGIEIPDFECSEDALGRGAIKKYVQPSEAANLYGETAVDS